jgi:hypothetical protein
MFNVPLYWNLKVIFTLYESRNVQIWFSGSNKHYFVDLVGVISIVPWFSGSNKH